tara:strand:- start:42189 stop:43475 length:1287 start_codon:yes stop_codon:yes gene_type:complete
MLLQLIIILNCLSSIEGYGWVPLLDLKRYNTKKPSEIKILDKNLVIWEKNNEIIVQDNACLHRGGPLSEGYIDEESKNLRCSYHGWEFNNDGSILSIPQQSNNCKTCKLKQKTYDTYKNCHILWINLNNTYCEFPEHIKKNNQNISSDIFVAELPYSMNILLENLFDPSHVPFAHHKLQSTRDLASTVNSSLTSMNSSELNIYFEDNTLKNNQYRNGTMSFYSPCHYVLYSIYPESYLKRLHIYAVPILPFKTRIFVQYEYKEGTFKTIYSNLPSWFKHLVTHTFFDSDSMLLYKQEQMLRRKKKLKDCVTTYKTPTTSDHSIRSFHKWKKTYPQVWSNIVNLYENETLELSREQVFDRYNDHTRYCTHCMGALNNLQVIQKTIPVLLFLHSIYNNNIYESSIAIIIYYFIEKLKSYFIFRDYVHNEV